MIRQLWERQAVGTFLGSGNYHVPCMTVLGNHTRTQRSAKPVTGGAKGAVSQVKKQRLREAG